MAGLVRGEHRADQKERIRRTAAALWARQGYHATGIQELCEAVSLGRAALYHHIGSKQELLFEVITLHVGELIEEGEQILEVADASAADKFRRMSRGLMRNISDNRAEWTVFHHEVNTLTGQHLAEMVSRRGRYEAVWNRLVDEGVRSREFRALDAVVLKGMLGMHNYAYLWLRPHGRLSAETIADEFSAVLLRGVVADGHH